MPDLRGECVYKLRQDFQNDELHEINFYVSAWDNPASRHGEVKQGSAEKHNKPVEQEV